MDAQRPASQVQNLHRPRLPRVWDYDIDADCFCRILRGEMSLGRLDRDWAAVGLIEYAPYAEIVQLLGFRDLLVGWPRWRRRIRSEGRWRGIGGDGFEVGGGLIKSLENPIAQREGDFAAVRQSDRG